MTAKEYLNQAYWLNRRIDSKLEQQSALRDLATKTTAVMDSEVAEALELERKMILQYDSTNPEKGYNVVLPADGKDLRHYSVYTLHSPEGKIYAGYTGMPLTKRWKNSKSLIHSSKCHYLSRPFL